MISGLFGGLIFIGFVILNGGGLSLTLFAIGEGISLLIAMEENTRATTMLLTRMEVFTIRDGETT